jgi:hypothetical protein
LVLILESLAASTTKAATETTARTASESTTKTAAAQSTKSSQTRQQTCLPAAAGGRSRRTQKTR